jgi:hypothetical protein
MAELLGMELLGGHETIEMLDGVEERFLDVAPAFMAVSDVLQQGERKLFAAYHGKYVLTGRTMRSLTERDGGDAIRKAHADGFEFGSVVPYAKYLKRGGASAVLDLTAGERHQSGQIVIDYVTTGVAKKRTGS